MPTTRHFLGWERPVLHSIVERLLALRTDGVLDLRELLLIVPTRQADRRLREALAMAAAELGAAVLPGPMMTPELLVQPDRPSPRIAEPMEALAMWSRTLAGIDLADYPQLFPKAPAKRSWRWAMRTSEGVNGLRHELGQRGWSIAAMIAAHDGELPEAARWGDLARLEAAWLAALADAGLQDRSEARAAAAAVPLLPEGVLRIIVLATPDPLPLCVSALEALAEREEDPVDVEVWIQAPESEATCFDSWGRPQTAVWGVRSLPIPDPERSIELCANPVEQARRATELLAAASAAKGLGIVDFAVGVPDPAVATALRDTVRSHGLDVFDPAGKPLGDHAVVELLTALSEWVAGGSFTALARLVRHPDVLAILEPLHRLRKPKRAAEGEGAGDVANKRGDRAADSLFASDDPLFAAADAAAAADADADADADVEERPAGRPTELLAQLDRLQNEHLPRSGRDLRRIGLERQPRVLAALDWADHWRAEFDTRGTVAVVRDFLRDLYQWRQLDVNRKPEDRLFEQVAKDLNAVLEELNSEVLQGLALSTEQAFELLLHRARRLHYYPEREPEALELEGWLELAWNDAPYLVITGMNDGHAPESIVADMFLPDALRERLGLSCNASRFARDAYLLRTQIESRPAGDLRLLCGKVSAQGDPLKPSRLLFLCPDEVLPTRVRRLFGELTVSREAVPRSISWQLQPPLPTLGRPEHMAVTELRGYLACPFRYYLNRRLKMQARDDRKVEMDAMDYGSLIHHALDLLGKDTNLRAATDPRAIAAFLQEVAAKKVHADYGPRPPLPVTIQLESAQQRLAAVARVHANEVAAGWRLTHTEYALGGKEGLEFHGIRLRSKIDRIDVHEDTGRVRILDYKTSDKAAAPRDTHLVRGGAADLAPDWRCLDVKGKRNAWVDLQIPLYYVLLRREFGAGIECGYLNLPKAVTETGIALWSDFDDDHAASAETCATAIIDAVSDGIFWPPTKKVDYDDFADLLFDDAARHVDGRKLQGPILTPDLGEPNGREH